MRTEEFLVTGVRRFRSYVEFELKGVGEEGTEPCVARVRKNNLPHSFRGKKGMKRTIFSAPVPIKGQFAGGRAVIIGGEYHRTDTAANGFITISVTEIHEARASVVVDNDEEEL